MSDQPEIVLERWQVMQLPNGDQHVVGWNDSRGEGRVSSVIVQRAVGSRRGRTASGRVYQLQGSTGHDPDAGHTWNRWMNLNGATSFTDLSLAVQAEIDAGEVPEDLRGPSK